MMNVLMMVQPLFIGTTELLLIGGMALLLFGGKKLPEMMRGLGQGVREFKKGVADINTPADGEDATEDSVAVEETSQPEPKGVEKAEVPQAGAEENDNKAVADGK